jgi:hypothetical protein
MSASLRTIAHGEQRSGRGTTLSLTAAAGDLWVVGFFHSAGTFQYIKYDTVEQTVYSPHANFHFAVIVPGDTAEHNIQTYTDNGGWTLSIIWAISNANLGDSVLDYDYDMSYNTDNSYEARATLDSEPYGIICSLGWVNEHTHAYAWNASETADVTWHETDSSPWPTMSAAHKAPDSGSTTPTAWGSDIGTWPGDHNYVAGISIRGFHAYTQAASGGISSIVGGLARKVQVPLAAVLEPWGLIGDYVGIRYVQALAASLEPVGGLVKKTVRALAGAIATITATLFADFVQIIHVHSRGRPINLHAPERTIHLHAEGSPKGVYGYDSNPRERV